MIDYRDLYAWQKAMDLVTETYKLIKKLPVDERFALADQMRRAVTSIPLNIAEGHARFGNKEYLHFLNFAKGSNAELRTCFDICVRVGYLPESAVKTCLDLSDETGRLITGLSKKLV